MALTSFRDHPAVPLLFTEQLTKMNAETTVKAYESRSQSEIKSAILTTDPLFRRVLGRSVQAGEQIDEPDTIQSLSFPVALGIGENDPLINRDDLSEFAVKKIWNEGIHVFEGSGQSPQTDDTDQF